MSKILFAFLWLGMAILIDFGDDSLRSDIAFWGCMIISNIHLASKSSKDK